VEADDVLLRRVERTATAVCVGMAAVALVLARGRPGPAVAVLAGGLLAAVSYRALKAGVFSLVQMAAVKSREPEDESRHGAVRTFAKVVLRYALLALLAYVMIARLRLHPLGLLAGVSSVVAAVSIEAVRFLTKKT
jgi:hypothetical protein